MPRLRDLGEDEFQASWLGCFVFLGQCAHDRKHSRREGTCQILEDFNSDLFVANEPSESALSKVSFAFATCRPALAVDLVGVRLTLSCVLARLASLRLVPTCVRGIGGGMFIPGGTGLPRSSVSLPLSLSGWNSTTGALVLLLLSLLLA